jgi:hypothetical protein
MRIKITPTLSIKAIEMLPKASKIERLTGP